MKSLVVLQLLTLLVPVAQLDRVQPSEGWGRTFESCRGRHYKKEVILMELYESREDYLETILILKEKLGVKASVIENKIIIPFINNEDLNRIFETLNIDVDDE